MIILWPIRYGRRPFAISRRHVVLLLIAGGPTWELCTAALTGADNDAGWRDPGDVHGGEWQ